MTAPTNYQRLMRDELVKPKGGTARTWKSGGAQVSVMTREEAEVDGDWPWIASCDTHGEMLACTTKALAISAARERGWCSGCRTMEGGAET